MHIAREMMCEELILYDYLSIIQILWSIVTHLFVGLLVSMAGKLSINHIVFLPRSRRATEWNEKCLARIIFLFLWQIHIGLWVCVEKMNDEIGVVAVPKSHHNYDKISIYYAMANNRKRLPIGWMAQSLCVALPAAVVGAIVAPLRLSHIEWLSHIARNMR